MIRKVREVSPDFSRAVNRCSCFNISSQKQNSWVFLGLDVTAEPSEKAQHHSLHHWQRASARLLQWQRPRLTQGWWWDPPTVTSHWRLLPREGPEPRSALIFFISYKTGVLCLIDRIASYKKFINKYLTYHNLNKLILAHPIMFSKMTFLEQPVVRGGTPGVFLWLRLTVSRIVFATATAAMPERWGRCVCWWVARRPPPLWATSTRALPLHLWPAEAPRSARARGASVRTPRAPSTPAARTPTLRTSTALTLKGTPISTRSTVEDLLFSFLPQMITNAPLWRILLTWALWFDNHSSFLFDLVFPGCAPQVNHSWTWLPLKLTVWYLC